jgi:hypothetical protein
LDGTFQRLPLRSIRKVIQEGAFGVTYAPPITLEPGSLDAAAQQQLRMQKALTLMNIQLHHVISDISGLTGLSIVRAIVGGERDPKQLAKLRDPRIRASKETIEKSLQGHWQEELLFDLKMALESYDHFQSQIVAYDEQIRRALQEVPSKVDVLDKPLPAARRKVSRKRFLNGALPIKQFWEPKIHENCQFHNTLTVRNLPRVFMGSTRTRTIWLRPVSSLNYFAGFTY